MYNTHPYFYLKLPLSTMNLSIRLFLTVSIFFYSSLLNGESRTWTSTTGSTMNAELVDFSNRIVILKSSSGKKISLKIEQLTLSDQSFVKQWVTQKESLKISSNSSSPSKSTNKQNPKLSSGLAELIPSKLLNSKGEKIANDVLAGKMVGFYFSAHWCPPCRGFTPSLVQFRDKNKKDFEVVFISSDKSPEAQMKYMKETKMNWFTLPHRSKEGSKLSQKYGVRGIPALIIVSANGETISTNGRNDVSSNPGGAIKIWKKSS